MGNQTKYETSEDVEKDDPDAKKLFDPFKLEEEITAPLFCSTRLGLFIIFLLATCNMIVQRYNINFAVVCMHQPIDLSTEIILLPSDSINTTFENDGDASSLNLTSSRASKSSENPEFPKMEKGCPVGSRKKNSSDPNNEQIHLSKGPSLFNWSKETQGSTIAAFYYGIVISQIPSSSLVDKYGAKKILILSQLLLSILSIVNPILARVGPEFLFVSRFFQGVVNGPALPAINVLAARWCGSTERSLLMGISGAGFALAAAVVYPISAFFCEYCGWDWIFYFAGGTGLLWCLLAYFTVFEWPEHHPRIQKRELSFLQKHRAVQYGGPKPEKIKVPWMSMLLSLPVWALFITNFSCFWCFLTVGTYLPTYLNEVLQLNISENGFLSALPFVGMMTSHFLIAMFFDWLRKKNRYSITVLRKSFNSIGMFPAAFCMAIIAWLPCDSLTGNVTLFMFSQSSLEFAWMGGYMLSIFEIAPRYTSSLTAVNNAFAYLAGFISAAAVSWMTSDGTRDQWLNVFYLSAGINVFGGLFYLAFGKCTLLSWAAAPHANEAGGNVLVNGNEELQNLQVQQAKRGEGKENGDTKTDVA